MLPAAFALVACAVLLGTLLALLHLRAAGRSPPWPIGALHGLIGASGLGALLIALRGPPRGVAFGVGPFGVFAAALLALALLAGLVMLARLRFGRRPGTLLAAHAMLAVAGFVVLAGYTVLG